MTYNLRDRRNCPMPNQCLAVMALVALLAAAVETQSPTQPVTQAPLRVGAEIPAPPLTKHVDPEYPAEARAAGVEGTVQLDVTIGTDGKVIDVVVVHSIPPLDAAAMASAKQWEFAPVVIDGSPVAAVMTRPVRFVLNPGTLQRALADLDRYAASQSQQPGAEPTASIEFDSKGADFNPWLRAMVAKVRRNWLIPTEAKTFKGRVLLTFVVHRDGKVTDVKVGSPSTLEAANRAAYNAIIGAGRFDALPDTYRDDMVTFTVTFFYNEGPPARPSSTPAN